MSKMATLEAWAADTYGDASPGIGTLRRWAREGRITPRPVKHGRTYFVARDARYVALSSARRRLVDRIEAKRA